MRIADYFEGLADEAGLRIAVTGAGHVYADAALLRRAVANLVDNAIRHARPRSTVRVEVAQQASGTVITVTNDGPGIAAADLPHIFDRFYRVDRTRRDSASSTGLGLAIVKSIMSLHRGRVEVRSSDAHTEFRLVFPPVGVDAGCRARRLTFDQDEPCYRATSWPCTHRRVLAREQLPVATHRRAAIRAAPRCGIADAFAISRRGSRDTSPIG